MAKASKKLSFVTPVGFLRWPKVSHPDTKGKFADGKFKTDFVPKDEASLEELRKKVMDFAVEHFGEKRASRVSLPMKVKETEDGDEIEFFRATTKTKPKIVDVKGKLVRGKINIGGGTVAKLSVTLNVWEKGVNAYLNGVQILKLESFGGDANFEDASADMDDDDEAFVVEDGDFADESTDDDVEDQKAPRGKTQNAADF